MNKGENWVRRIAINCRHELNVDDDLECVYVHADGETERGTMGCQPSNTFCISHEDTKTCSLDEIEDNLRDFFDAYNSDYLERIDDLDKA